MLEKLKYNIGKFLLKLKLKKNPKEQSVFNGLIRKSKKIFIIMPEKLTEFDEALDVIRYFTIHGKETTVFVNMKLSEKISDNVAKIEYDDNDITRLNLPSKQLIDKLNNIVCDLVIDLNRPGKLFYAAVSNSINGRIRFASDNGELMEFYNFYYCSSTKEPAAFYRSLISFFNMF